MGIASVYRSVKEQGTIDEFKRLNEKVFEDIKDSIIEDYRDYNVLCNRLKELGMDIEKVIVNMDYFRGIWYMDGNMFLDMHNMMAITPMMMVRKDIVSSLIEDIRKMEEEGDWLGVAIRVPDVFQIDFFRKNRDKMSIDEQQKVLEYLYTNGDYASCNIGSLMAEVFGKGGYAHWLKKFADEDGNLVVYRGATLESTDIKNAKSFTLSYDTAVKFATRFGCVEPTVYKAKVNIKDVILYTDCRGEKEVVVDYESLKELEVLDVIKYYDVEYLQEDVLYHVTNYLDVLGDREDSGIHGYKHSKRMIYLAHVMQYVCEIGLTDEEFRIIIAACVTHDIGRTHDGVENCHGLRSAKKIDKKVKKLFNLSNDSLEQLKIIVQYHNLKDKIGEKEILNNKKIKNPKRCVELFRIFKDIDNLDRVRCGDLKTSYLRHDYAKLMAPIAYILDYHIK